MDVSQGLSSSNIENKFLRIFLKILKLNRHENHLQHTKYLLLWGPLNYEWFTKGHYKVFSKTNESLGPNNGKGRITMALGIEQNFLDSNVMEDTLKHHIVHLFSGIFAL